MLIQIATNHPEILPSIVSRTPAWVWGLLAGLIALGLSQAKARQASLTRVLLMPITMTVLALFGVVSVFGAEGQMAGVLAMWSVSAGATLLLLARLEAPAGTRYDSTSKQFYLVGSWVPLFLILCIFMTKYIVGVETAMEPTLSRDPAFALTVSALYGTFSGVFIARTLRLLRLTSASAKQPSAQTA